MQTKTYCNVLLVSTLLLSEVVQGDDGNSNEPVKHSFACRPLSQEDYYPPEALRLNIQGRVLVEFSIDKRGRPAQVSVTQSPNEVLSAGATRLTRSLHCKLSDDWWIEGANHRARLGIYYVLIDCKPAEPCTAPPNMRVTDTDIDESMIITAQSFRRR